ncbi:MAG: hypothetical protein V8T86_06410 [Victivallis sp.]
MEAAHISDDRGDSYTSFTRLIHNYFPQFEAEKVASRTAKKHGKTVFGAVAGMGRGRRRCERLQGPGRMKIIDPHEGTAGAEHSQRRTGARHVCQCRRRGDDMKSKYQFIAAEKILFSPRCLVAGTVDLLMADGNTLWILDYKTNKAMGHDGYGMGLGPLAHLANCNYEHYARE